MTFTQSVWFWIIVFAFIGASTYVLDRKVGIHFYGWIRKWTSPKLEPENAPERGFIYNRRNKVRWFWAGFIASLNFFFMVGWKHDDPRVQLMHFVLITPATMIGFLLGPLLMRFKMKREELFEKMDAVESGKTTVGEEVKKLGAVGSLFSRFKRKKPEAVAAPMAPPVKPPVDPAVEEADARKIIEKFGGGL